MSQPTVVAEKLSKWYGKVVGVNDVTVEIGSGVIGILGPNGAGKSTFMKLLIGALRPSRGRLKVLGERTFNNRRLIARIGYCPEHDGLYDDLTGLEFVTYMARLSGFEPQEAKRRAEETLGKLELLNVADRAMEGYSKGMRQRVKIAQALVHDPELLILDEPLTGCDPLLRQQIGNLIKSLGKEGRTVLVSSHILHEVEAMTHNIILMYKGAVLAEGDIYSIRDMIDERPHQIRITCEQARGLARELIGDESVRRMEVIDAETILVETYKPDTCYSVIPEVALQNGFKLKTLTSPDNNLQAVFEYLTQNRGPAKIRGGKSV